VELLAELGDVVDVVVDKNERNLRLVGWIAAVNEVGQLAPKVEDRPYGAAKKRVRLPNLNLAIATPTATPQTKDPPLPRIMARRGLGTAAHGRIHILGPNLTRRKLPNEEDSQEVTAMAARLSVGWVRREERARTPERSIR
jgi:hypothetical protein